MSLKYTLLLAAMLTVKPVFADENMMPGNKSCEMIVKSCLDAGYTRDATEGKQFWQDCMKPLVLGKTVSGITIDPKDAKACREAKIKEMKQELNEMKEVK